LTKVQKDDLFKASRDRLADIALAHAMQEQLEQILSNHADLRQLEEQRRQNAIQQAIKANLGLEKGIAELLKRNKSLAAALGVNPANFPNPVTPGPGPGPVIPATPIQLHPHPTYLRFAKDPKANILSRKAQQGKHIRELMEIDAKDNYLTRTRRPGSVKFNAWKKGGTNPKTTVNGSFRLDKGNAHLGLHPFPGTTMVGDTICYEIVVTDKTGVYLAKKLEVTIEVPKTTPPGPTPPPPQPKKPAFKMPGIYDVFKNDPNWILFSFTDETGLHPVVNHDGTCDFFINMDNAFLLKELNAPHNTNNSAQIKYAFSTQLVLLAMSTIEQDKASGIPSQNLKVEDRVHIATSAFARIFYLFEMKKA
jgi:hypothetical protein